MTARPRTAPRVLVTGASIAGPTLAWGLDRAGFDVTLLERSPERRQAGQNIDVRGLGREVLRRMDLEDVVMANLTGEEGTRFVDGSGRPYAEFPRVEGQDGPTAEVEILRGTLAGLLLDRVPNGVEVRQGDYVTAVAQDAAGVDVTFDSGREERYDLLLVAEGRSSRTRRLLLADHTEYRDRGVTITYGTLDRTDADTDYWDWFTALGGRVASIRPDNVGSVRASLSFESEPMGFESLPVESQLTILRERFRGAGWQTDRILEGFAARPEEFYAQRMEQVVVSPWSTGRVALVGDAAWGSGPTGMGTTLALVGAHVLTGELARDVTTGGDSPAGAFRRYEDLLRRYADSAQGLPPGGARIIHPSTRAGVRGVRAFHRVAAWGPVRGFAQRHLLTSEKHEPALPDYQFARGVATRAV
ncbi:FAD-dependent monooxygenase [Nocardioides lentus]|uniref:FAD-dependent monooxygenase n=1 Tax=Nocardioides lentus TaxID=338077 RepID=A0ABN2NXL0_9ACTN